VPTLSQLANETGLVRTTVRLSLRRLEERGLIQVFSLVNHWNLDTGRLARDVLVVFAPRYVAELTADEWEVVGAESPSVRESER
jgi:DNA-binding Lrp family transcriptional regulator